MPVISNEFIIRNFPHVVGSMNMAEAWVRFLSLEDSSRDKVSLWCARLSGPMNGIYHVFNTDTVVLFFYVILIESLLETRVKCSGVLTCEKHGDLPLKHNLEATLGYWRSQLNEKLKFSNKSEYVELVVSLYSQMRHPFAHEARLLPETKPGMGPLAMGPHTRFLHLPEVISNMNGDSLARSNARMLMHDIVWLLLLSSIFPGCLNEPWRELDLIKEYRSYGAR